MNGSSPSIDPRILRQNRIRLFFFLSALVCLFCVLVLVKNVLVSFLLAIVSYFILAPIVDFLERRGLSRVQAIVVPFLALTFFSIFSILVLSPLLNEQGSSIKAHWPEYQSSLWQFVEKIQTRINSNSGSLFHLDLAQFSHDHTEDFAKTLFQSAPDWISQSVTVLLLAPFFCFFMLLHGRSFLRHLINMVPNSIFELVSNVTHQIVDQMGDFVRARLAECIIVFILMWAGLQILGFPSAFFFAALAAILNIIPYLGPVIGFLPPALVALAQQGMDLSILGLLFLFVIVQIIDAVALVPFLVAKIVDLHPVFVILALLIGAQWMGIVGMIICIPLAGILKVTAVGFYEHYTGFRRF